MQSSNCHLLARASYVASSEAESPIRQALIHPVLEIMVIDNSTYQQT